jgi:hypothetical protein
MNRYVSLIALGLIVLVATQASAAPLTITESVDFPNVGPGAVIGTLDAGVNTISGSVAGVPGTDPADYFQLTLPAFATIVSVHLEITNYTNVFTCSGCSVQIIAFHNGAISTSGMSLFNTSFGGNLVATGTPSAILTGPATLGIGFLAPFVETIPSGADSAAGTFNYSLSYTVETTAGPTTPAPEPASLVLLTSGLTAAGVRRWRKRT